ncbi:MAG TPA: hypothetical protein VHT96_07675 [Clostridia bacterium]|nr:hypothetical protein [Clostridia bacterium]
MYGKNMLKLIPAIGLIVSLIFMIPVNSAAGGEDIFSDVKARIGGITEAEKATLQKLFTQTQLIAETQTKAEQTEEDIKNTSVKIETLKKKIGDNETRYGKERESLKQVLQSYQRMGAGSYLEILLESDSLKDLLTRINTLRDLTNNTGKLLDQIEEDRRVQSEQKAKLSDELLTIREKQHSLQQTLTEEKKLKADLEKNLASLSDERGRYEEYLGTLQKAWDGIAPLIRETAAEITDYSKKASIPADAFKITFGFFTAKISIDEKTINDLLAGDSKLEKTVFSFKSDMVTVAFPDRQLSITGKFVIKDQHILRFEADGGSIFGMALDKDAIAEVLKDVDLEFDLEPQLNGSKLKSVEIEDGFLNITI